MGKTCEKCGKDMGFFHSLRSKVAICKECAETIDRNIKTFETRMSELVQTLPFTEKDEHELYALRERLQLSNNDIGDISEKIDYAKRLTRFQSGQLPILKSCDLILQKNEICHYSALVDLIEEKRKSHYVGGSRGVSVRIVKGLSYRVGGFKGERVTEEYNEITDNGRLYITNKRVVFSGNKKSVAYPLKSIVVIQKFGNAIQFKKENEAKPKYFGINMDEAIEEISVIVTYLVQENIQRT